MYPAPAGWIWFNFWWARASYLKKLVEPVRSTRRHYYEDWLGRLTPDPSTDEAAQLLAASTDGATETGRFEDCRNCVSTMGLLGAVYEPQNIPAITHIAENSTALELAFQEVQ